MEKQFLTMTEQKMFNELNSTTDTALIQKQECDGTVIISFEVSKELKNFLKNNKEFAEKYWENYCNEHGLIYHQTTFVDLGGIWAASVYLYSKENELVAEITGTLYKYSRSAYINDVVINQTIKGVVVNVTIETWPNSSAMLTINGHQWRVRKGTTKKVIYGTVSEILRTVIEKK